MAKVETSSMTTASHLKQIKLRELMANVYSAVRKVVNTVKKKQGGGRITLLRVKHEDSHDTLLEPLEISHSLRDYAIQHYGQENDTPWHT